MPLRMAAIILQVGLSPSSEEQAMAELRPVWQAEKGKDAKGKG